MKWLVHVAIALVLLIVVAIGATKAIQLARQQSLEDDSVMLVAATAPRPATQPSAKVTTTLPPTAPAASTNALRSTPPPPPATPPHAAFAPAPPSTSAPQTATASPAVAIALPTDAPESTSSSSELDALRERLRALEEENATFRAAATQPAVASLESDASPATMASEVTGAATTQPAAGDVTVAVVPLVGNVGIEIQAKLLDDALKDARAQRTDHVVIYLHSPGGLVSEVGPLLHVLKKHEDLKPIAYVDQALSAAALIALACPEIYIAEQGQIGAAVAFHASSDGDRKDVDAKFREAWFAQCRSAAIQGGHAPLLGQAMSDTQIELSLVPAPGGGPPIVKTTSDAGGRRPFKKRGAPLVLTGAEAVDCGLARKTCDPEDLATAARGLSDWTIINEEGFQRTLAGMRFNRTAAEIDALAAEVARIEAVLGEVRSRVRRLNDLKRLVLDEQAAKITAVNAEYATRRPDRRADTLTAKRGRDRGDDVRAEREAKAAEMRAVRAEFATATRQIDAAVANLAIEQRKLEARRDELNAAIERRHAPPPPPVPTTAPTTQESR